MTPPSLLPIIAQRIKNDEGVSEIVSYTMMFALGAIALVFSLDVLVDAQHQGNDIAVAQQMNDISQATAASLLDAARAAETSPNATFDTTVTFPATIQANNFTLRLSVSGEPTPTDDDCDTGQEWRCFWHPDPAHDGCPKDPVLHVSTGDQDLDAHVPLSNRTTAQATANACLVLDTSRTVTSSAGAMTISYERKTLHGHELPVITMKPTR